MEHDGLGIFRPPVLVEEVCAIGCGDDSHGSTFLKLDLSGCLALQGERSAGLRGEQQGRQHCVHRIGHIGLSKSGKMGWSPG
jgi:hypothetical protein